MCYISLRKNGRMTKKYYVICSITTLPLLAFWAIMETASFACFQDRLIVYVAVGGIGLLFLLSDLWFRNNMFYTFLFSFMAAFIQFSVSMAFEVLRESFAWELKMLTGTLAGFYMSLFFSVLFLLLTYLPRREKKRRDKAAVIVPLAFVDWLRRGSQLFRASLRNGAVGFGHCRLPADHCVLVPSAVNRYGTGSYGTGGGCGGEKDLGNL